MTVKARYQSGEPIWADLSTPDHAESLAFYGPLLGWTRTEPDPELGGYANFRLGEDLVAGVVPTMAPEQPRPGPATSPPTTPTRRPRWSPRPAAPSSPS